MNLEESGYQGEPLSGQSEAPDDSRAHRWARSMNCRPGIDCAVLAIPGSCRSYICASLRGKGIGSLIVFSAGFAEGGEDGRKAQSELARIARGK